MSNKTKSRSFRYKRFTRAQRLRKRASSDQREKIRVVHDAESVDLEEREERLLLKRIAEASGKCSKQSQPSVSGRVATSPVKKVGGLEEFITCISSLLPPDLRIDLNPCLRSALAQDASKKGQDSTEEK